jgi:hypothetical protein
LKKNSGVYKKAKGVKSKEVEAKITEILGKVTDLELVTDTEEVVEEVYVEPTRTRHQIENDIERMRNYIASGYDKPAIKEELAMFEKELREYDEG